MRLYRALLVLYPRAFRERFGEPMAETFRDGLAHRRQRHPGTGRLRHWVRTVVDLARTLPPEWWSALSERLGGGRDPGGGGGAGGRRPAPARAGWTELLAQDLRHAIRSLVRTPRLAGAVLVTLTVGIGTVTAFFSLLNAAWLRPLPYPDAQELVGLLEVRTGAERARGVSPELRGVLDDAGPAVQAAGSYRGVGSVNLGTGERTRAVRGVEVGPDLFATLGVEPRLGRLLGPADTGPGSAGAVVLSHDLWSSAFGSDGGILGRTVQVDGAPAEVVGVMPPGFAFPERGELWLPLTDPEARAGDLEVVARLSSPRERARAALTQLPARAAAAGVVPLDTRLYLTDLVTRGRGRGGSFLWLAVGTAAAVLLIACSNVASLLLARSARRRGELAVRGALGASRGRLMGHTLLEGGILAAAGAAAGLGVAAVLPGVLVNSARIPAPSWFDPSLDVRVLGFAAGMAAFAVLVVALPPALDGSRTDLGRILRGSGSGATADRRSRRIRSAVVVAEVALSFLLVAAGTLLAGSVASLAHADLGGDRDRVVEARFSLTPSLEGDPGAEGRLLERVAGETAGRPGVERVALRSRNVRGIPTADGDTVSLGAGTAEVAEGGVPLPDGVRWEAGSPELLATVGLASVAGAGRIAPGGSGPPGAVVSRSLARRLWPRGDAVGRGLRVGEGQGIRLEVVGVVEDRRRLTGLMVGTPTLEPELHVYLPLEGTAVRAPTLLVRSSGPETGNAARAVREALRSVDPGQAIASLGPWENQVLRLAHVFRIASLLVLALAAAGTGLAALGLYGLMAQGVAERTREIGIRTALGGSHRRILWPVVGGGLRLVAGGLALGLALTLLLLPLLRGLLFGVAPADPRVLAGVALLFLAVGAAATVGPARRALGVDPVEALRTS